LDRLEYFGFSESVGLIQYRLEKGKIGMFVFDGVHSELQ